MYIQRERERERERKYENNKSRVSTIPVPDNKFQPVETARK